jgi:hypothetical protein
MYADVSHMMQIAPYDWCDDVIGTRGSDAAM